METETNYYATPNDEAKKLVDPELAQPIRRSSSRTTAFANLEGAAGRRRPTRSGSRSGKSSSPASAAERQTRPSPHDRDRRRPQPASAGGRYRGSGRARLATALLVLPAAALVPDPARPAPRARPRCSASASAARSAATRGGFTLDNYATVVQEPGPVHHEPDARRLRDACSACSSGCRSPTSSRPAQAHASRCSSSCWSSPSGRASSSAPMPGS